MTVFISGTLIADREIQTVLIDYAINDYTVTGMRIRKRADHFPILYITTQKILDTRIETHGNMEYIMIRKHMKIDNVDLTFKRNILSIK